MRPESLTPFREGNSNADNAVLTPSLYTPELTLGSRISNAGMPTSVVPRMYHSSVTLTPQGNFLVAGALGPVSHFCETAHRDGVQEATRTATRRLDRMSSSRASSVSRHSTRHSCSSRGPRSAARPPSSRSARASPCPSAFPPRLSGGRCRVRLPARSQSLKADLAQVSLMDLGFSSHAFHSGARLVFMDATISRDHRSLTFTTPPNGRVYPPGPAFVFLTVDDVSSEGVMVMMGSGRAPPTLE